MGIWTTQTTIEGPPERVLDVLTDPEQCRRWSPIGFEVDDLDDDRLRPGSRARVAGRLGGRELGFEVEIFEANDRRLALRATGPIDIEASYDVVPVDDRARVTASVAVRNRGGLTGRLLSGATDAMLAAGALDAAVQRIARAVEGAQRPALV